MNKPIIREISLKNLLSFGPSSKPIRLEALNVLIGPNGVGKSNLLEVVSLLKAAPKDLSAPVKEAGGVRDWIWRSELGATSKIEVIIENKSFPKNPFRHVISFREHGQRFEVVQERIEDREPRSSSFDRPYYYYKNEGGFISLREKKSDEIGEREEQERPLKRESINPEESVLSQVKDPERYPTLAYLSDIYTRFRIYREWSFGRYTQPRQPQKADLPHSYLSETCENLGLVLNALRSKAKTELIESLANLYPEIEDFNIQIKEGWVQLVLEEGKFSVPATRLSDGTLRFLCLLAILYNPDPPPLVCIEEPELGLHPDVLPDIAKLLLKASSRCQLIVTTHSDILIDELTESPEAVVVCEKHEGETQMKRLNRKDLRDWLGKYRLGQLWVEGEIGGKRW